MKINIEHKIQRKTILNISLSEEKINDSFYFVSVNYLYTVEKKLDILLHLSYVYVDCKDAF